MTDAIVFECHLVEVATHTDPPTVRLHGATLLSIVGGEEIASASKRRDVPQTSVGRRFYEGPPPPRKWALVPFEEWEDVCAAAGRAVPS